VSCKRRLLSHPKNNLNKKLEIWQTGRKEVYLLAKNQLKMIETIYRKIGELLEEGSRDENLRIAFPRWFGRYLQEEMFSENMGTTLLKTSLDREKLFGINILDQHPYYEVVVYDCMECVRGERFIKRIPLQVENKTTQRQAITHNQS
jgi:hypothetical protein